MTGAASEKKPASVKKREKSRAVIYAAVFFGGAFAVVAHMIGLGFF